MLSGDRLTLMSAVAGRASSHQGSPQSSECPVHIHLPLSAGSPPLPLRNLHYSQPIRSLPKANCASNPLLFLFPSFLLMRTLWGCFDCLRGKQGQSGREGGEKERRALLTPAASHPGQSATLPPQLITPGKAKPFPGEPARSLSSA